ncbi:trimethylguanosine synthase [Nematocida sp. AWRm80]|nr:trimethylguanosine synthase [Nematocida sp. AWRm80]
MPFPFPIDNSPGTEDSREDSREDSKEPEENVNDKEINDKDNINKSNNLCSSNNTGNSDTISTKNATKSKKRDYSIKRRIGKWNITDNIVNKHRDLEKYYYKMKSIFPIAHGNGLLVDYESWYSITPRIVADGISKCIYNLYGAHAIVLDLFSGVGGNTISLLKHNLVVTSIELDYQKIKYLRHNVKQALGISDTSNLFTIIHGNVFFQSTINQLSEHYDVIIASPPWGGIDYLKEPPLSLLHHCKLFELERIYKDISNLRLYMVPRNIPEPLLHKYFDCKVFDCFINNKCIAKLIAIGPDSTLIEYS